jgi:hypothetical protein
MSPVNKAWLLVGALKAFSVGIFSLVWWLRLPPLILVLIPLAYVGVLIYSLMLGVRNAAAMCGIVLVLLVAVWYFPGPIQGILHRLLNRGGGTWP